MYHQKQFLYGNIRIIGAFRWKQLIILICHCPASALIAVVHIRGQIDNLSPDERYLLKRSIDDIVRDTPQTTVAVNRFKKLVAKAGKVAAEGLRDILVDIASEAAKKAIWPS
jgi:hypothetical protein